MGLIAVRLSNHDTRVSDEAVADRVDRKRVVAVHCEQWTAGASARRRRSSARLDAPRGDWKLEVRNWKVAASEIATELA